MQNLASKNYREQSTQEEQLNGIVKALYYWLSYIYTVAKSDMLLESSLRYALCEYVERQMNVACLLEVKHPCFNKRTIDFVWNRKIESIDADTKKNMILEDSNDCYILECKYVSNATNSKHERQRIFNDLCRLYYIKKKYSKSRAFFLMAGDTELFLDKFQDAQTNTQIDWSIFSKYNIKTTQNVDEQQNNRFIDDWKKETRQTSSEPQCRASFSDWFNFENEESMPIETKDPRHIEYFVDFVEDYFKLDSKDTKIRKVQDNISFRTKLIAISSGDDETHNDKETRNRCKSHSVAIWEIIPID